MFPLNLYARVRILLVQFAHETAGAARTRSSLRPLFYSRAERSAKPRAHGAAGTSHRAYEQFIPFEATRRIWNACRHRLIFESRISSSELLMTPQADFASQDYFRDPAAAIAKLRAIGPVVEVRFPIIGKVWATTTQALADQVLKDTATFTIRKDNGDVAGLQWWMPGIVRTLANSMLSMDEPRSQEVARHRRRGIPPPRGAGHGAAHRGDGRRARRPAVCARAVPPISSNAMRESCRFR